MSSIGETQTKKGRDNRCLLYLTLLVLFVCIALVIVLIVLVITGANKPKKHYITVTPKPILGSSEHCMSEECVRVAGRLLDLVDSSADPCDDFHKYACSNWPIRHITPHRREYYDSTAALQEQNDVKLRELLEEKSESVPDSTSKARILYNTCLNISSIDSGPLLKLFKDVREWPVLLGGRWQDEEYDLESLLATLSMYGVHPLINTYVDQDLQNPYLHTLYLDQPRLGLPSPSYFYDRQHEEVLASYEEYAKQAAVLLGAFHGTEQIWDLVQFEKRLADLITPDNIRRDKVKLYNKKTLNQLGGEVSAKFDWLRYLNILYRKVNMHISGDDTVVVLDSTYLKNMLNLVESTPKKVVVNYAIWRLVQELMKHLGQPFLDEELKFQHLLNLRHEEPERWRFCLDYTKSALPMALGRIYVDEYFKPKAKQQATELLEAARDKVMYMTEEMDWISSTTRNSIVQRIRNTKVKIGYPSYITNNTALNYKYKELSIKEGNHIWNVLNVEWFRSINYLRVVKSTVDPDMWTDGPYTVKFDGDLTVFSAGLLQPPYFYQNVPQSIVYGGAGNYMVAELLKHFSSENVWSLASSKNLDKRGKCFEDQYSRYVIPKLKQNVDGIKTRTENIQDAMAVFHGYQAYRQYLKDKGLVDGDLPSLPGLKLSHDQLFFLSHAQMWCYKASYEGVMGLIHKSSSPPNIRLNGALSNNNEFSKAFNCRPGTKMSPEQKCQLS